MKSLTFSLSFLSVASLSALGCSGSPIEEVGLLSLGSAIGKTGVAASVSSSAPPTPALPDTSAANGGAASVSSSAPPTPAQSASPVGKEAASLCGLGTSASVAIPHPTAPAVTGTGPAAANGSVTPSPAPPDVWDAKGAIPYAQSGKRLEARAYAVEDVRRFRAFHDTELGIDCAFAPNAANEFHCVPTLSLPVVFADSGCSEPVTWDPKDAPLKAGTLFASSRNGATYDDWNNDEPQPAKASYRVGAVVFSGTGKASPDFQTFYSLSSTGECVSGALPQQTSKLPPPLSETHDIRRLEIVKDAEFVAAQLQHLSLEQGLQVMRLSADDGAEVNIGAMAQGQYCSFYGQQNLCVPKPVLQAQSLKEYFWGYFDSVPQRPVYGISGGATHDNSVQIFELSPADTEDSGDGRTPFVVKRQVTEGLLGVPRSVEGNCSFRQEWYTGQLAGTGQRIQIQSSSHFSYFEFKRLDGSSCFLSDVPQAGLRCGDSVVTDVRLD